MTNLTPAQYALAETAAAAFERGVAAYNANDLAAAQQAWAFAVAAYEELIGDGATQFRPNRADTLVNWGNALQSSGDLPGALARCAEAKTVYDELIESAQSVLEEKYSVSVFDATMHTVLARLG